MARYEPLHTRTVGMPPTLTTGVPAVSRDTAARSEKQPLQTKQIFVMLSQILTDAYE